MKTQFLIIGVLLGIGLGACSSTSGEEEIESTPTRVIASRTPEPEEPTNTPLPTNTPIPTSTATPSPTSTNTPTPVPTPIGRGGLIAFSSIRLASSYSDPAMDIVVLNPNVGECTTMTGGENDDFNSSPSWSPDGSEIVYTKVDGFSSIGQGGQLYSIGLEGDEEVEVDTPFGSGLSHPSWSQNDEIIVSRSASQEYPQLWMASAKELEWGSITPDISFQFNPVWAPDGKSYAFAGAPGEVYSKWFDTIFGGFRLTSYDIAPRDIWLVDVGTGQLTPLTDSEEDEYDPAWSPDGQQLAYVSVVDDQNPEIFIMNKDGSNTSRLTNHDAMDMHPSWSPDGEMLTFASNREGNFEIYLMNADGENPLRMTNNVMDDLEPVWSSGFAPGSLPGDWSQETISSELFAAFSPPPAKISSVADTLAAYGILSSSSGKVKELSDFSQEWAQMNWYTYYRTGSSPQDFIIRADASWESASDKANWWNSGCGFVFREEDVYNHYLAYLDLNGFTHIDVVRNGNYSNLGRSNISYPLERPADGANIMLIAQGSNLYFFVDGYLMHSRQNMTFEEGNLALTLLSGTNKDFGTRCEMTNIEVWELDNPE